MSDIFLHRASTSNRCMNPLKPRPPIEPGKYAPEEKVSPKWALEKHPKVDEWLSFAAEGCGRSIEEVQPPGAFAHSPIYWILLSEMSQGKGVPHRSMNHAAPDEAARREIEVNQEPQRDEPKSIDGPAEPSRSQIQRKAENIEVNEADDPHREDQGFKHLWTAHLDPSRLDNQLGKNMQPGEDHEEQRRPHNVEIVREGSLHEAKGQPISHHGVMKPETRDQG